MRKKNLEMLFLFLAAFMFASCSSDNDDDDYKPTPKELTLTLTPADGEFSSTSSTFTLKVETTDSWTASSSQSWCSITKQEGTGSALINGTIEANTTTDTRTAIITVKANGTEKTITLTQLGKGEQSFSIALSTPADGNVSADGGSFSISIIANGNWNAASNQTWSTLSTASGTGNATLTGTITANTDTNARTVQITVTAVGGSSKSITLTQKGKNGGTDPDPERPKGYAGRIEIPVLKGGDLNLFYTHTVNHNGDSKFINYSAEYDCTKKHTRWVAYVIDNVRNVNTQKRTDKWGNDSFIPAKYQTNVLDYKSPYNRGHLVASGDRTYSYEANVQTFLYSNMSPQYVNFNGKVWEQMETQVRNWGKNLSSSDTVYVDKGGYIDGPLIGYSGPNKAAVPQYYFMAILKLQAGKYEAMAFWIDQSITSNYDDKVGVLGKYAITIDELEKKTGINFFHNLPNDIETAVESKLNKSYWGL